MNTSRHLGKPLQIHHHTLRNRIIMGSMHTGFEEHEEGAEHLAAFYTERAKGGAALIITGGIAPNEAGAVVEGGAKLTTAHEVTWHQTLTRAAHQHGAKICMQLLHTGRYAMSRQPLAPSAIQAPINPAKPRALTTDEVKQTVNDYIQAARLAQEAGYDGVEVMGSEGYLINQFLARATNTREDEYGGSLDNRQRFAVEIVQGIRQACGDNFIIIYRISLLDLVENGSTWQDNQQLARKIEAAGASMFNTGIGWHEARVPTIATMVPRGAFATFTGQLKAIASIPVVATNRINMPAVAEDILKQGLADAVCLARPFLADPAWANKAISNNDHCINTCIACNQACLDHLFEGKLGSCLVNPFACHELQLIQKTARETKNIAVVGAGPAGLAFAKVACERGHKVTLFEQANQIGGQLNIAKTIPGKNEFHEILRYYNNELERLGVRLCLGQKVNARDVSHFDEVVVATGIQPRSVNIKGIEHPKVLSYLQVLKEGAPIGESVAIIGAGGIGFDVAEYLSLHGEDSAMNSKLFQEEWQIDPEMNRAGSLLSTRPKLPPSQRTIYLLQRKNGVVGKNLGKTTGWIHRLSLKNKGVHMLSSVQYLKIDDQGLHIKQGEEAKILPVDNIVICAGQEPLSALFDELTAAGVRAHKIGGASQAGELDAKRAIRQGVELALDI